MAAPLVPVLAAIACYGSFLGGNWIFDDTTIFVEGSAMDHGDWWQVAFGAAHTPLANRPFTCLTFAWNPAIGGTLVSSLRTGNLVIHVLNALLLFGIVRRTLLTRPSTAWGATSAAWTASALATVWAGHPLGVDAVSYITQRSTLLMSCGLLAALYCVLRAGASRARIGWSTAAVVTLALGMASKEDLVAGPVLVALFERAFLLPDWRSMRSRLGFHIALASTWIVLGVCIALGPSNNTVGFAAIVVVTPFEWLMTQASVILHYLRLVVWPTGLRCAYDWGIERSLAAAWPALLAVAALFVVAMMQWRRRPWLGWLGSLFFLLLGPTSSLMPIVTEVVAERRMYLPMLAVLTPLVIGGSVTIRRWLGGTTAVRAAVIGAIAVLAALSPMWLATRAHAATYQNSRAFWNSAHATNELTNGSLVSAIILAAYAKILNADGHRDQALAYVERAMKCEGKLDRFPLTYAELLRQEGRIDDSERVLRDLLRDNPTSAEAMGMLAHLLVARHEAELVEGRASPADARLSEAAELAQRAWGLDAAPSYLTTLGMALTRKGNYTDAESVLRRAVRMDPTAMDAMRSLGAVLCFTGRTQEGIATWQQILARNPGDEGLRVTIGNAHLSAGDREAAATAARDVLSRDPENAAARSLLEQAEGRR